MPRSLIILQMLLQYLDVLQETVQAVFEEVIQNLILQDRFITLLNTFFNALILAIPKNSNIRTIPTVLEKLRGNTVTSSSEVEDDWSSTLGIPSSQAPRTHWHCTAPIQRSSVHGFQNCLFAIEFLFECVTTIKTFLAFNTKITVLGKISLFSLKAFERE